MMKINDMGKQEGTVCIDLSQPQSHYTKMTPATNIAIVFTNTPPKGHGQLWIIEFVQDGKGGKTVTFPASLTKTPKINLEPNAISIITFSMKDGNNILVQSQTENKIQIEEEDFQLHDYEGISCLVSYCGTSIAKERLQQILQDHKDAKQCKEFHYREHQAIKDRQIVKKLEEEIKVHNKKLDEIIKVEEGTKSCGSDFHLRLLDNRDNLQKILEEEK